MWGLLLVGCGPESYWLNSDGGGAGLGGSGAGGHLGGTGGGGMGAGGVDAGSPDVPPVTVHFDFETAALDGWQVAGPRPLDIIDQLVRSTEAFHQGSSALAMVFDGQYTPLGATDSPYYGVYTGVNPPPPNAAVSVWAMSTAPGVAVLLYIQLKPAYLWQALTISDVLTPNVWTKVTITMPSAEAYYLGCLIQSSLDVSGTVYIDDISW